MTSETITRLTKGSEEMVKRMICKINNPAYIAPENDRWRHENSSSDDEDEKMSQMIEKKTRWWFVRDGKRKRTPKMSPVVPIPKEPVPKIVVKGPSKEPQQRLVDGTVLDPSSIPQEGVDLAKVTFEQCLQHAGAASQKDQTSSAQGESVKEKEPEGVAREDSSETDSESTETETELDQTTLRAKKPTKKQKGSDEEDSTYVPPEKTKKLIAKRKAVQSWVLPRKVRARKCDASLPERQAGKKEKHVDTSKVQEVEKTQSVEVLKALEVQTQNIPEVVVQKQAGDGDDYVEITGFREATPPLPPPPPQDQPIPEAPESSRTKNTFPDLFGELPHATGVYRDDMGLDDDFDAFNSAAIKALERKLGELEKDKAKAEAERDVLKKQVEELKKENEEIKTVMINQAKKFKKFKDGLRDNSQLFELLTAENDEMNEKIRKLQEVNQTLNQMLSEINEASSNEMKAMKLEMEAMKADKVMKDEQLNMLYTVMESHLNIDVHVAFNNIEVKRAEERRFERERVLAQQVTQRRKGVIVDTE
ncbi:hypothetical protein Hanom_Chr06g00516471 [Helianthus anomalus]